MLCYKLNESKLISHLNLKCKKKLKNENYESNDEISIEDNILMPKQNKISKINN